jgi:hypothetical protein
MLCDQQVTSPDIGIIKAAENLKGAVSMHPAKVGCGNEGT